MKKPIYYCKSWFRAKKKATEIWTSEQARTAHVGGKLYTVLVDSVERPYCFLEVGKDFVAVEFLDDLLRVNLSYQFQQVEPGRLFLSVATYREFEGQSDSVLEGTTYVFSTDGDVKIRKERFNPHALESSQTSTDVQQNYVAAPSFGEYGEFIRVER